MNARQTHDTAATLESEKNAQVVGEKWPVKLAGGRVMKFAYPSGATPLEGYTLKRGIGVGGFGEVYFALSDAGKEVALKRIQRNLDVELRGVKQCLNLKHVNLISLWDIRTNNMGESWVVMEYVPGPSLRDVVNANPTGIPDEEVKEWFASTCAGVAYLHEKGIVHRDLKPGNIFYDADQQVIKIGDYGLSKFISCSGRSGHTESVGTFHYMAPEIGKGAYGKEIDIYALGIILFEILTGRVPFEGESSQEIIMKHLTADPDLDGIPADFRKVIHRCLLKDPELRYSNVPEMLVDVPWPDIAEIGEKIIKRNAMGPVASGQRRQIAPSIPRASSHPTTVDGSSKKVIEADGGVIEPVLSATSKPRVKPGEILFGDVRDTNAGNRLSFERSDPVRVTKSIDVRLSTHQAAATAVNGPNEPIANAVHSGAAGIGGWLRNENVSTPLKVLALIGGTIVILSNSEWLLPASLGIGLIYLVYYGFWTWSNKDAKQDGSGTDAELADKVTLRLSNVQQDATLQQSVVRDWLGARDWSDRSIELLGSLLIAAVSCIVFNLFGIALTNSLFNASIENWAEFTWMSLTCVAGSWLLLGTAKFWEHREAKDPWVRRLITAFLGALVGLVAYFSAVTLHVNVAELTESSANPNFPSSLVFEGLPMMSAFLVFFMGLFFVLRWWRQADPVRTTRLSIWSVGLCLVWAAAFSHILDVAPLTTCIMAVVVSISVQLASPWLHPEDRTRITRESIAV